MKLLLKILICMNFFGLLSPDAFAQKDGKSVNFGILICTQDEIFLKKPDGSSEVLRIPGAKPFEIRQVGNTLFAKYPNGPDTAYHGAIFVEANTQMAKGSSVYVQRFEKKTADSRYVIDLAKYPKDSHYTLLSQSVSQGVPNVLVSWHRCR